MRPQGVKGERPGGFSTLFQSRVRIAGGLHGSIMNLAAFLVRMPPGLRRDRPGLPGTRALHRDAERPQGVMGELPGWFSRLFEGLVGLAGGRHRSVMKHFCVSSSDAPGATARSAWTPRSPRAPPQRRAPAGCNVGTSVRIF